MKHISTGGVRESLRLPSVVQVGSDGQNIGDVAVCVAVRVIVHVAVRVDVLLEDDKFVFIQYIDVGGDGELLLW